MAILAECPICHKKQAVSRKQCIGKLKGGFQCEADLKKLKRQKEKVRYYISFCSSPDLMPVLKATVRIGLK